MRDSDIIPESYQMRLMAWRDEFTRGYFEIGDIANEIILLNIQSKMKIDNASIFSAVGRFCGKSGRTVRDYAEISAFFPVEIREYYDMLPFSHFRFAKSCGRDWEAVLEYSIEHPDASEAQLSFEFSGGVAAEVPVNDSVAASVAAQPPPVSFPSVAASVAAPVAAGLSGIYSLSNLISRVEEILSWELKKDTRRKLVFALDNLKDVLSELSYKEPTLKFEYSEPAPFDDPA